VNNVEQPGRLLDFIDYYGRNGVRQGKDTLLEQRRLPRKTVLFGWIEQIDEQRSAIRKQGVQKRNFSRPACANQEMTVAGFQSEYAFYNA
jgi:hypothetical protein